MDLDGVGSLIIELGEAGLPWRGGMGGGGSISRDANERACDVEGAPPVFWRDSIPWVAEIIFKVL